MPTTDPAALDRPKRNPKTAFRDFGADGGLVVLPGRAEVKVLNAVAMAIYPLLDGTRTRDEIVAKIVEEFDISAEEARTDLDRFLADLAEHGMLAGTDSN